MVVRSSSYTLLQLAHSLGSIISKTEFLRKRAFKFQEIDLKNQLFGTSPIDKLGAVL